MSRRLVSVLLKAGVSLALVTILALTVDVSASWTVMGRLSPGVALAAAAMLAATTVITAARWWLVMAVLGSPIAIRQAVALMFMGNLFSQALPTSFGGDALRVWYARQRGAPYQAAISGVLLERASGLLGLAAVVAAGLLHMGARVDLLALRILLFAALPAIAGALVALALADRIALVGRVAALRPLAQLAVDTRRAIFVAPVFASLLALSVVGHVTGGLTVYVLAQGLGVALAPGAAVALVPAVVLITLFPVSLAGWGVREGAMVLMLSFAGVRADAALALSVLFGLSLIVAALPGAVVWLMWRVRPLDAAT